MTVHIRRRRIPRKLGFLAALTAVTLAVGSTLAVHQEGIFELDGNAVDSTGAGLPDDWDRIDDANPTGDPSNDDSSLAAAFVVDPTDNRIDQIFTGGGSKDDLDIDQWRHTAGAVPDKDDITDAFAGAYSCPDGPDTGTAADLCLYFGLDRFARNGDAQVGFWFFKENITLEDDGTFGGGPHQVGDILALSDFTNGGAVSTIKVFKWVGSGGDTNGVLNLEENGVVCGVSADAGACAVANTAVVTSPWAYNPKSGPNGSFPLGSFFEGGINLNTLGLDIGCGGSFMAETRSSQSVDATLKDFALGDFALCSANIQVSEDGTNPVGTPHPVTGHVNVVQNGVSQNAPEGTTITFSITSGPGALTPTSCTTVGTTGSCTVTLNSSVTGTTLVHATSDVTFAGSTFHVETDGLGANSDDLQKIWIQNFRLIVITCDDTRDILADGTVSLSGASQQTISAADLAALGWKDSDGTALTEADVCNQGGASYGGLNAGTYNPSVELPDEAPLFP